MTPTVAVIVLNYQGEAWLEACLSTLLETDYPQLLPLLVDNRSTDGSIELVEKRFPSVEIIRNARNEGFAEGNNIGIRYALEKRADYVVLLNPDTKVTRDWLREMVEIGESDARVGIIGAVQMEYDSRELNSWTRTAFPAMRAELEHPEAARRSIDVEWVEGACFAIKRQVLEDVGLLDPIYYAFYEEIDYCRRAALHDWKVVIAPRARIHHFRGGSWNADSAIRRERDYRCDRSQFIYTLTEPRRTFLSNVGWYFVTLGTKGRDLLRDFSLGRMWDLLRIQIDLLGSCRTLISKWKRERVRVTLRPPGVLASTNADQNPRRTP